MRNAWALFDPETGRNVGYGNGQLDRARSRGAVVVYRDKLSEIKKLQGVEHVAQQRRARKTISKFEAVDRADAKQAKAACAQLFIDEVPEPAVIDPSDPDAIPEQYVELYDEYWSTYDIDTAAANPWELAALIVQRAEESRELNRQRASIQEARLRRDKVLAEAILNQPTPPIPDE